MKMSNFLFVLRNIVLTHSWVWENLCRISSKGTESEILLLTINFTIFSRVSCYFSRFAFIFRFTWLWNIFSANFLFLPLWPGNFKNLNSQLCSVKTEIRQQRWWMVSPDLNLLERWCNTLDNTIIKLKDDVIVIFISLLRLLSSSIVPPFYYFNLF